MATCPKALNTLNGKRAIRGHFTCVYAKLPLTVTDKLVGAINHTGDVLTDFDSMVRNRSLVVHRVERSDTGDIRCRNSKMVGNFLHGFRWEPASIDFLSHPESR
jgi:hypothetical protein